MKNLMTLIFILSFYTLTQAQSIEGGSTSTEENTLELEITVTGLKSEDGKVFIGLYSSEELWLKKYEFSAIAEINNGQCSSLINSIPAGTYAISLYHDKNDNNKLDTGWFGIPKEPYGCSNGAKGKFGPPKWQDAKFEITESTQTIEIKL